MVRERCFPPHGPAPATPSTAPPPSTTAEPPHIALSPTPATQSESAPASPCEPPLWLSTATSSVHGSTNSWFCPPVPHLRHSASLRPPACVRRLMVISIALETIYFPCHTLIPLSLSPGIPRVPMTYCFLFCRCPQSAYVLPEQHGARGSAAFEMRASTLHHECNSS